MLRMDRKSRLDRDNKALSKLHAKTIVDKLSWTYQAVNKRKVSKPPGGHSNKKQNHGHAFFARSKQKISEKENKANNQNTPKLQQNAYQDANSQGLDQLSQIKFISKECSSIKDNHQENDFTSNNMSGNHLQDFSPLFDRLQKKNSKDDFVLEIEDVYQSDLDSQRNIKPKIRKNQSFRQNASTSERVKNCRGSIQSKNLLPLFLDTEDKRPKWLVKETECPQKVEENSRCGKIKKNIKQKVDQQGHSWIDQEITDIFLKLNNKNQEFISKNNCHTENLSTQLNYLIGSILGKIKVTERIYNFSQFCKEFKELIKDIEKEQLKQIISNNKRKVPKNNQETHPQNSQEESYYFQKRSNSTVNQQIVIANEPLKEISFQTSPTFKNYGVPENKSTFACEKINRINDKLNNYLQKNNVASGSITSKQAAQKKMSREVQNKINQFSESDTSIAERLFSKTKKNSAQKFETTLDTLKMDVSLKNDFETIKGREGQQFSLVFTVLNRHL